MKIEELRSLYDLRFSLIPIEHRGKMPCVPWASYQRLRASWDQVFEWNARFDQTCNWAVVCGAVSDLAVVDIDPRNGGDLSKILEELDRPTYEVVTGGGGSHLYFRLDGKHLASSSGWRKGVDLQAEGKYVVAPGSVHASGKEYRNWGCTIIQPAPDVLWTPAQREDRAPGEERPPWVAEALAHPELVEAGTQNETLNRLAWYFAGHLEEDIGVAVLATWGSQLKTYDQGWGWNRGMIEEMVARVYEDHRKKNPRLRMNGAVPAANDSDRTPPPNPLLTAARGPKEFMEERAEQVEWIVEDLVAPGCITELLGAVKAGKSTWLCGFLSAMARGEDWLGKETRRTKALYVSEQEGLSLQATLTRGKLDELGRDDIEIITMRDLFSIQGWDVQVRCLVELAKEHECKLIVIDTLAKLSGMKGDDENSAGRAAAVTAPFNEAKADGLAIVFLRHGRKSGGNLSELGRGSSAFSGDVDVIVGLTQIDKKHKNMEVKGRLSEPFDLCLEYKDGTYSISENPALARAEAKDEEAWALITTCLREGPMTVYKICRVLKKVGACVSRGHVERLLALYEGREVSRERGARGVDIWRFNADKKES